MVAFPVRYLRGPIGYYAADGRRLAVQMAQHGRVDKARAVMLRVWYQALARRIHPLRYRQMERDSHSSLCTS